MRGAALLALLVGLVRCATPTDCGQSSWAMLSAAARAEVGGTFDPTVASTWGCPKSGPAAAPQAIAAGGSCAAAADDDACVACLKTSCCAEGNACFADEGCACLTACRMAGDAAASCSAASECNASPGAAYLTMTSCAAAHCASQCPRLQ